MSPLRLTGNATPTGRSIGPRAGGVGVGCGGGGGGGVDGIAHGKSHSGGHSPLDEEQLHVMKQKVETLQADLSRRQESYIRRERAFNMRIEELEEEIGSLKVCGKRPGYCTAVRVFLLFEGRLLPA